MSDSYRAPHGGLLLVALSACLWLGCGDSEGSAAPGVDVYVIGDAAPAASEHALFEGQYSTLLPVENPNSVAGTLHTEDPKTRSRMEEFAAATEGSRAILILPEGSRAPVGTDVRLVLQGCWPNDALLDALEEAGQRLCPRVDLGTRLTFANVQFARIAPMGPFDIYRDYATQVIPVLYEAGGCAAGFWRCDPETTGFDGILIAAYPSITEILDVARATSARGPGGVYEDASYEDLRLGGAEFLVRNFVDVRTTSVPAP